MGQGASECLVTGLAMSPATLVGHGIKRRLGGWVIERDGTRAITRRATEGTSRLVLDSGRGRRNDGVSTTAGACCWTLRSSWAPPS